MSKTRNIKRKRRNTKARSKITRRCYKRQYGGNLPIFLQPLREPTIQLLKDAEFITSKPTEYNSKLEEEEKTAIIEYQTKSDPINGFLREGFDYYTMDRADTDIDFEDAYEVFIEDTTYDSEDALEKIQNIDNVFLNKCPRFAKRTVLFRGTPEKYDEEVSKGYISTTKQFETLFDMLNKGDDFLSKQRNCCMNLLIVDEGISYLDLEIEGSKWAYQQEILLPRNLRCQHIDETEYRRNDVTYKVYVYHVTMPGDVISYSDYSDYDIHNDKLFAKREEVKFLLSNQVKEIDGIMRFVKESLPDEFVDKIVWLLHTMQDYESRNLIYLCSAGLYSEIRRTFLMELGSIIDYALQHDLVKEDGVGVESMKRVREQIDALLKTETVITPENMITFSPRYI
jgi:hypothetical protein